MGSSCFHGNVLFTFLLKRVENDPVLRRIITEDKKGELVCDNVKRKRSQRGKKDEPAQRISKVNIHPKKGLNQRLDYAIHKFAIITTLLPRLHSKIRLSSNRISNRIQPSVAQWSRYRTMGGMSSVRVQYH
ncbi:hypothetical protein TNCV_2797461 [Trichonephila clavipes]|nr:hypothetical protein TNCV_2797461 [Trichonephila clavipes]